MLTAILFFIKNLNVYQMGCFIVFFTLHIMSHIWHLNTEKYLAKSIPKILSNYDDNTFYYELSTILLNNILYLVLYAITMFIIETIGKMAIMNAINNISKKLLKSDLSTISKKKYEHNVVSIVHHSENVSSAIRNLFIEFPKKVIVCYHFLVVLYELSFQIMLYCVAANMLFIVIAIFISFCRKYLLSKIIETNIRFSLICSDISNSIQTYKVDGRITEYTNKIENLTYDTLYNSSLDSLMVASNESITTFSSQFILGLISYLCRPMVIAQSISIEDLMYGIRSSSKFIEKLNGVLEYIGNVIREYKSFIFFITIDETTIMEKCNINTKLNTTINQIDITVKDIYQYQYQINKYTWSQATGRCIRIMGLNGVGKTTLLLQFLGVAYKKATSHGQLKAFNDNERILLPTSYRNSISFVQQNIPLTYDSINEYIQAVSKSSKNICYLVEETLNYLNVRQDTYKYILKYFEDLDIKKSMRELSGGQSKFIQFMSAIIKLYTQKGLILILDEPTNNLDIEKVNIIKILIAACISKNVTIIMITHDDRISNDNIINIEI